MTDPHPPMSPFSFFVSHFPPLRRARSEGKWDMHNL